MAGLTIGKFADAEGVGVETVRFYQRRGLLAQPARGRSGFREYTEDDRWRLAFIRRARGLGFTLAEISDLLGPAEARSTDEIVRAAETKLAAVAGQAAANSVVGVVAFQVVEMLPGAVERRRAARTRLRR